MRPARSCKDFRGASESEPRYDLSLPRRRDSGSGGVEPTEAAGGLAIRNAVVDPGRRLQCFGRSGGGQYGAIEGIGELRPNTQAVSFRDSEQTADPEILLRTAPPPVIAVVGGRRAPLARCRISPCLGIQYKRRVWIEATAVEILGKH